MDLTKVEDQLAVKAWIKHPAVKGVFLAPPCGTASTARQIELPGEDAPKPLRTLDEPNGIADLSGQDMLRVSAANVLYEFTAEIMDLCTELGKACMVENPKNSLFWVTTWWVECDSSRYHFIQDHQACAYGGQRPKWTRLTANFEHVHTISLVCPQNHEHLPWGVVRTGNKRVFATSLEVHYPRDLCDAIAHAFVLCFVEQGMQFHSQPTLQHVAKASTLQQTTTLKLPPLVPQFKSKFVVFFNGNVQVWPSSTVPSSAAKQLHEVKFGETVSVKLSGRQKEVDFSDHVVKRVDEELNIWRISFSLREFAELGLTFDRMLFFGLQWEPQEFLERALQVTHPVAVSEALPSELARTVEELIHFGHVEVAKRRLQFFQKWNKRARDLEQQEAELRANMDPLVERAVRGKRILLFQEMLSFYEYPDMEVVSELRDGSSLTGEVPATAMLPFKFTPSVVTCESLRLQSKLRRQKILSEDGSSGDPQVDEEVWAQTLDECTKGWLRGPLDPDDVPLDAPISKRFGLKQKHKVRLIDDFTESAVNQSVTVTETPVLHTVDVACALVAHFFGVSSTVGTSCELVVRTFDLSSAYRQIALNAEGRGVAYIRVYNPTLCRWELFQALVLPFGAVRSVHSFLRLARAVWWLGAVGCLLPWSSFFDDYIVFSTPPLAKSTDLSVCALFKLLGWLFAQEGRKCMPFGCECEALGVIFDLAGSSSGVCRISNTPSRISELKAEIDRILEKGWISQTEAQKLRGRMQFADSQIYGRTGKRCTRALRDFACRRRTKISNRDATFLKLFIQLLESDEPRRVVADNGTQAVIVTDACYERDSKDWPCGLGGVLVDPATGKKQFFSCALDAEKRLILGEQSKKQIIFEAETLCAVLAYMLWTPDLECGKSFLYVDNEGTKFCLIRGASENDTVDVISQIFAEQEVFTKTVCWIARVSSFSNIADDPSRGDSQQLIRLGFEDVSIQALVVLEQLTAAIVGKMGTADGCRVKPIDKKEQ
eukprot:s526_g12.t1